MPNDYSVYAVTDRRFHPGLSLTDAVEATLRGGATIVQLREKEAQGKEFLEQAVALKHVTSRYSVPLIINDRIDIAQIVGAGLHIGQEDIPLREARRLLPDATIGVSVSTVAQAVQAEQEGATYLGVGSLYQTATKTDASQMTEETLKAIRQAVELPLVGIGGITKQHIPELVGLIEGYAVVSALFAERDIERATRDFKTAVETMRQTVTDGV